MHFEHLKRSYEVNLFLFIIIFVLEFWILLLFRLLIKWVILIILILFLLTVFTNMLQIFLRRQHTLFNEFLNMKIDFKRIQWLFIIVGLRIFKFYCFYDSINWCWTKVIIIWIFDICTKSLNKDFSTLVKLWVLLFYQPNLL